MLFKNSYANAVLDIFHKADTSEQSLVPPPKLSNACVSFYATQTRCLHLLILTTQAIVFVRETDNFQTYVSEVLREILHSKPDALKSGHKVEVQQVLQYSSLDEFRAFLIDQKVDGLAYRGFSELANWMEDFGLKGVDAQASFATVTQAIELRNCIVHRRSRASKKYVQLDASLKNGERLSVGFDEVFVAARAYCDIANYIDEMAISKFGVPLFCQV